MHSREEMGHPQTQTPIQTGDSTVHALLTNKIMPKALKAMDMQLHWLCCREAQNQYHFYWRPGTQNLADYWTKHHPASHHKAFWPQILTSSTSKPATEVCLSFHGNFHPLVTSKNTVTKSFVKKILSTPVGGPVQDLSKFQMAPIPFLSDLACSTYSPQDIMKV